jgi:hypothetical protein
MELNLLDQSAISVDMLAHGGIRQFLELIEVLFKDPKFGVTLCTVSHHELLPCVGRCFASHDPRICRAVMLDRVEKVIIYKIVSLIALVDDDFVRRIRIQIPFEEPVNASIRVGLDVGSEIDFLPDFMLGSMSPVGLRVSPVTISQSLY